MKPPVPALLLITDSGVCPDLPGGVAAALAGGVTHVLLREKAMVAGPLAALAASLLRLTTMAGAYLLIHDRVDIAMAVQADGVHLPEDGMTTVDVRRLVGTMKIVGRSCHAVATACRALQDGADFVTLSPLFATKSHPGGIPLGVQRFATMRAAIPGPVLALGGIHQNNVADAMRTGATGVALIRGILDVDNPQQAARAMARGVVPSFFKGLR